MSKSITERIEKMPIPVVATAVGTSTLGNVYSSLGFTFIRHFSMALGTIIFLAYLYKIVVYTKAVKGDYDNTIFASLYGVVSMLLMLLSSYYIQWFPFFKYILIFAVIVHAMHILVFVYLKVIKKFEITFFMPSWFVTFNGIMVSTVVGAKILPQAMATAVLYWGIGIYTLIIGFLVYRLLKHEIKKPTYHTQAILLAPCSLIVASYINIVEAPSLGFLAVYYSAVVISLGFIIVKLPKFFSVPFNPGFAGLTFPMAIGIVASSKMAGYLANTGYIEASNIIRQVAGVQIFLTTAIISFVWYNFFVMFFKKD